MCMDEKAKAKRLQVALNSAKKNSTITAIADEVGLHKQVLFDLLEGKMICGTQLAQS